MTTVLVPQEIYLLERYTSLAYLRALRDTWAEMISHLETCLDRFMHELPPDYRARPLPEQPDAVWGELVLPNFRDTLDSLNRACALLQQGDFSGLHSCNGPISDFKGQMEFWSGWMTREDENRYGRQLNLAVQMASNIQATEGAYWDPEELTTEYDPRFRGPLDPPAAWPQYQLSSTVTITTGSPLTISGIYLPDVDNSCAQFLHKRHSLTPPARIAIVAAQSSTGTDTGDLGSREVGEQPCRWTLVRRTEQAHPNVDASVSDTVSKRVPAGSPCPQSGYWFTPAQLDSQRYFEKGEILPSIRSEFGTTIWQWYEPSLR